MNKNKLEAPSYYGSVMREWYEKLEPTFSQKLKELSIRAGFKGEVEEIIVEARGDMSPSGRQQVSFLCRIKDEGSQRLQIDTVVDGHYGLHGSRFEPDSLSYSLVPRRVGEGVERFKIRGREVVFRNEQYMQIEDGVALMRPDYLDLKSAALSFKICPELYKGCETDLDVAYQLIADSVARHKSCFIDVMNRSRLS